MGDDARTERQRDYARALDVCMQWNRTWIETGSPRALDAALVCSRVAREKFRLMQQEHMVKFHRQQLILLEREAELETIIDEVRATIAECRRESLRSQHPTRRPALNRAMETDNAQSGLTRPRAL